MTHQKGGREKGTLFRKMIMAGAMALAFSGGSKAIAQTADVMTVAQQWAEGCNGVAGIEELAGQITGQQIAAGFGVMERAGLKLAIEKMSARESCLSLVASDDMQTPVYVVEKPAINRPAHQPPAVTRQRETRAFVDRLTELDIQLFSLNAAKGQQSLDAMMEIDENMAHETLHFGTIAGKKRLARSFAASGDQACVVGLDRTPLARFAENRFHGDINHRAIRLYLKRYGNATEFWHEVAHCNPGLVAQRLDTENGQASKEAGFQGGVSCSSNYSSSEVGGSQKSESEVAAASIGQATQASAQFAGALDTRSLFAIREEAMADEWATTKVAKLGGPAKGCNYEKGITHPWQQYRVADSIQNPVLDYTTWLYPWIEGQDGPTQKQMMADAFKGAFLAAKATLPEYRYEELVRGKSVIAGSGMFAKPSLTADPDRAKAWQNWLIKQVSESPLAGIASPDD